VRTKIKRESPLSVRVACMFHDECDMKNEWSEVARSLWARK
jgi:hypothetical protein